MVNHHPARFGGHGHSGSGDIMVSVCLTISQDHLTKGLSNSSSGSPSM